MASEKIELLAYGPNVGIVHYHGRKFPGVLIQGDTLESMRQEVMLLLQAEHRGRHVEAREHAEEVLEKLGAFLAFYESTLEMKGIDLPYTKKKS